MKNMRHLTNLFYIIIFEKKEERDAKYLLSIPEEKLFSGCAGKSFHRTAREVHINLISDLVFNRFVRSFSIPIKQLKLEPRVSCLHDE